MASKKKINDAKKLKEKITKLDELEMFSIYQILEKNKVNITNNMNGVHFDLLSVESGIYKTIEKFVDQSLKRKEMMFNVIEETNDQKVSERVSDRAADEMIANH